MTPWLTRATRTGYILVILLVLATPILLAWQHYGMTRSLEISPQHHDDVFVTDDRSMQRGNPSPGNSVASLTITPDAYILHCQMRKAARYPYCAMRFRMGDPARGIDMSRYDTIAFDVRYAGHGRRVLKLHLLNFEPEFYAPDRWDAQRFNEVLIDIPPQGVFTIPMNALRTADWWHFARQLPLSRSYVRLDRVTTVELQADDLSAAGHTFTVEVRKIAFRGKWMSRATLLNWLMAAWIVCGMLGLSLGLLHFRSDLQASETRLAQLAAIDRERKEAAAAREAALAEAVALARQRSQFLAQMSHELRTPLNAIIGYAQLLRRECHDLTERQSVGLATIHESGQHLLTLINSILELARVEAGKMELHPAAVHLDSFVQVLADIMRVKAEEKGLAFGHELAHGLPAAVTVDETRLRQVLLNLLGNAVKFTDSGTVSLRVLPAPQVDGTARLRFEVADSGIGMTPQQLGRIFQPFGQVASAQRREGGTGLGLAISQQLVHLMGGHIDVVSEPGKGSTFRFDIDAPVAYAAPAAPAAQATPTGYEGERKRLLVVDDVPQNRAMMLDLLQQSGFIVAAAANGLECLVLLDSFKPDLILMDVMMPVMDGNETTRQIRRMPGRERLPIIAVTASAGADDERLSRAAGADAFLAKPVDHDLLLRTVGRLLALTWTGGDEPAMSVPPAAEIEALWRLAQIGDMRQIRERAGHLRGLDPAYGPFATRLDTLAQGYRSKQLMAFVARFRTDAEKVLDDRSV